MELQDIHSIRGEIFLVRRVSGRWTGSCDVVATSMFNSTSTGIGELTARSGVPRTEIEQGNKIPRRGLVTALDVHGGFMSTFSSTGRGEDTVVDKSVGVGVDAHYMYT